MLLNTDMETGSHAVENRASSGDNPVAGLSRSLFHLPGSAPLCWEKSAHPISWIHGKDTSSLLAYEEHACVHTRSPIVRFLWNSATRGSEIPPPQTGTLVNPCRAVPASSPLGVSQCVTPDYSI